MSDDEVTNEVVEVGTAHDLGPFLQRLRAEVGLTIKEVADYCGVTHVAIVRIEQGHNYPKYKTLLAYVEACGVDLYLQAERPVLDEEEEVDFEVYPDYTEPTPDPPAAPGSFEEWRARQDA